MNGLTRLCVARGGGATLWGRLMIHFDLREGTGRVWFIYGFVCVRRTRCDREIRGIQNRLTAHYSDVWLCGVSSARIMRCACAADWRSIANANGYFELSSVITASLIEGDFSSLFLCNRARFISFYSSARRHSNYKVLYPFGRWALASDFRRWSNHIYELENSIAMPFGNRWPRNG